jgi:dTDP-4-amino-4,6-dideoxygalactose transaminase
MINVNKTIPLFGIYRDAAMDTAALEVLHSGQIAAGQYVGKFASTFGALVNQDHVVTVNDMSSAILLALHLSGVRTGDEVLTTSYACMSTNAPIANVGAKPVWVDVDPHTGLMDPAALERAITPKTKAVVLYHLAGYPADVRRIAEICRQRGVKLIEDCDNALFAAVDGSQVGSFGDFSIYSFYPNRQVNATEGGALCCKRKEDAERAVLLRRYGIDLSRFRDPHGEINAACDIPEIGWAATLNNLCSAIGYAQLEGAKGRVARAREIAGRYARELAGIPGLCVVPANADAVPAYWAFLVTIDRRDAVLAAMKQQGVQVSKLHHRTDAYSGFGVPQAELPNTATFLDRVLGLPCGWWLDDADVDQVIATLKRAVAGSAVHTAAA